MQDALLATVDFLKANAGVITVFNDPVDIARVWGAELPEDQTGAMPKKQIVVRRVSGVGGMNGLIQLEEGIFDFICYGETPLEAERLRLAVRDALRACLRVVVDQTLIHSFDPSSAPVHGRDKDAQWPYVVEPWRFLASEAQAA